jgi:hypothetical protein
MLGRQRSLQHIGAIDQNLWPFIGRLDNQMFLLQSYGLENAFTAAWNSHSLKSTIEMDEN